MRRSKDDAEQTRIAIREAAERLFCQNGIEATTLERISRAAGVTRGAFYWHFKDKTDLLRCMHDQCQPAQRAVIEAAAEQGHPDPLGLLSEAAVEMMSVFETDESQQRLFLIMKGHKTGTEGTAWLEETNAEMFCTLARVNAHARDQGLLAADFTPEEATVMMMATVNGLLSEWLRSGKMFSLSKVGAKIIRLQMNALRVKPA